VTAAAAAARFPRVVDGDVKVSIDTSALIEAEPVSDVAIDPQVFASDVAPPRSASPPAEVLREPLPPNPYAE
jgi:hypothetical protein